MICTSCTTRLADDQRVCHACGHVVDVTLPQPISSSIVEEPDGVQHYSVAPTGLAAPFDTGKRILVVGRDATCDIVLGHPLVARRHAVIDRKAGNFLRDLGSRTGTYVNGRRVDSTVLDTGDVVQIGPFSGHWQGDHFSGVDTHASPAYRVDAVGIQRHALLGGNIFLRPRRGRPLLERMDLAIRPGEFVAIIGGSGAGKTTLLGILAGLREPTEGSVRYDGLDIRAYRHAFVGSVGFVPQDDIVHVELTVREALYYASRLRLSADLTDVQIDARVQAVMEDMDLATQASQPVRTLSGGQRKRVSIATELLADPPVLFLDEPSSGLDAGLDKRLMLLLRQLSRRGHTVVLVTHTPEHLDLCDSVAFLGRGGYMTYFGPPHLLLSFYGQPSIADVYSAVDDPATARWWAERYTDSPLFDQEILRRRHDSTIRSERIVHARRPVFAITEYARQTHTLIARHVRTLARDKTNLLILLLQAPIITLLLAVLSGPRPFKIVLTPGPTLQIPGEQAQTVVFVMACMVIWFGLLNSVREIVKERGVALRERAVGVRPGAYLAAKLLVLSGIGLIQVAAVMLVFGALRGFPRHGLLLDPLVEIAVTLVLAALAATGLGLMISAAASTADRAMGLAPYLLLPQILLAGVLFDLGWAGWLSFLTPSRWAIGALGGTAGLGRTYLNSASIYPLSARGLLDDWAGLAVIFVCCVAATFFVQQRRADY